MKDNSNYMKLSAMKEGTDVRIEDILAIENSMLRLDGRLSSTKKGTDQKNFAQFDAKTQHV